MDILGLFPVGPAYGRSYKRNSDVAADWLAGKDFRLANGRYCSIRDFADRTDPLLYRDGKRTMRLPMRTTQKAERKFRRGA